LLVEEFHGDFVQALWDNCEAILFDPLLKRIRVSQNHVRYSSG
jgi:hypothetical protein